MSNRIKWIGIIKRIEASSIICRIYKRFIATERQDDNNPKYVFKYKRKLKDINLD